jgi:hypothetical protein
MDDGRALLMHVLDSLAQLVEDLQHGVTRETPAPLPQNRHQVICGHNRPQYIKRCIIIVMFP